MIKNRRTDKPPKKIFIEVTEYGAVRIKNVAWIRKNLGDYCTLKADKLGGLVGLFGADRKGDNTVSLKGAFITITDAIEVLDWNLQEDEWYEVPLTVTDKRKSITLRMRKANMTKSPIRKWSRKDPETE